MTVGLPTVSLLVLFVGVLLASGAPRLDRLHRWAGQYRAYRRLEPLWRHLHAAFPEIARLPDKPWNAPGPRAVPWRLARRVVQIRDGLLLLAPYRRPDLAIDAPGTGAAGLERDAVIEAAHIAAALRTRAAGVPATVDPPDPPPQQPTDLDAELAWLQQVSEALARSPTVAADRTQPAVKESHDHRC